MIVYITTYLLSFICLPLDFKKERKSKISFLLYCSILILLIYIASVKDESTCPDTVNYINSFLSARDLSDFFSIKTFYFEPGYVFWESLIAGLGLNYHFLFTSIAFVSVSIYGYLFWKYSPYPFLSLFIFVSVAYITQIVVIIRYGLSTAIMLYALLQYINKHNQKFLFFAIIATLFHYTALTFLIFIPFYFVKNKNKLIGFLLFLGIPLYCVNITILDLVYYINDFLPPYFQFALSKGLQYVDKQEEAGIKQLFLYLPALFYLFKVRLRSSQYEEMLFVFLLSLFMMIEFSQAADLARINKMYLSIIYLLYPFGLKLLNKKYASVFYLYIILYCLYMLVRISFFNSGLHINVV